MLMFRVLLARCCCLNRCWIRGLCLLLLSLVAVPSIVAAQVPQTDNTVKFRLRNGYLIVVQAMINGTGPFDFLLDTGTTRTVIDPDLAQQLQAPLIGKVSLTGVLHIRQDKLVSLQDVRLGDASLSSLAAAVDKLERQKILAPGIRGILGEDFLSGFDILIDYRQHWLRFGDAPPAGERCRFETIGQYHGSPTTNRLLITAEFLEVSGSRMQLQLDTGAKLTELFPVPSDAPASHRWDGSMATSSGADGTTIYSNVTIKIGKTVIPQMDVVQSRHAVAFDAAGLLPAAIFHRIYISHSGGFVVLNPSE
jgi:hypothetical protein